jgi:hypothetical protein
LRECCWLTDPAIGIELIYKKVIDSFQNPANVQFPVPITIVKNESMNCRVVNSEK